jgi:hypothetical protein
MFKVSCYPHQRNSQSLPTIIFEAGVAVWAVWYLFRPHVKMAFGVRPKPNLGEGEKSPRGEANDQGKHEERYGSQGR